MDTFEKRMIKYLDAMFKISELFSIEDYAEELEVSVSTVKKYISHGIKYIALASGNEYLTFSYNPFVDTLGVTYGFELVDEIQNYIHTQDLSIWENVPKKGKRPTPREFIDYILERYRKDIFRYINIFAPFGALRHYPMISEHFLIRKYDFENRIIEEYESDSIGEFASGLIESDTISRIVICVKYSFSDDWFITRIIRSISGEHICISLDTEWQITLYDLNDNIIESRSNTGHVDKNTLMLEAIARDATYAVLSYRMLNNKKADTNYTVQYLIMNNGEYKHELLCTIKNIMKNKFHETQTRY